MSGRARRALLHQARGVASLWWWVRGRRQDVGPGDVALGHARDRTSMTVALAGVLAVEAAVVGFLVPWPAVHVLDALAVLQVLGVAAIAVTRPHYLHDDVLVLREGALFEVRVPLASVAAVRVDRRLHSGRTRELTARPGPEGGAELSIAAGNQTDVLLVLSEPVTVADPGGPTGEAVAVRFRADEPHAAVAAIKTAAARAAHRP
ncbi:hypothetical protein [Saccharothrix algeriensis]|uniref:Uncharacterized protein n=1 Tax=Saccharothrix algeriensis TaxID=173560 RepID=A0A8T8I033_9PSEU|nr:hypothetical protein [Saccharothrix algeriensis]MBM7809887.1 hypothetical protein [Saccharothrix algeriensis]QTR04142.1 hypothetical protein J7S33_03980 [Saccharothrix algeriensis]